MQGQVAAFGAWEVIGGIVNAQRCGFPVNVAYDPLNLTPSTPGIELLNAIKAESPRVWDDEAFDALTFHTALEYVKLRKPRVMFLSLGETDDWAHAGNYGEYLLSAHRFDADLAQLWSTVQSIAEYRGNTTLIVLTDHGRGSGSEDWKSHGQKIPDSKNIWIAMIGPGIPTHGIEHSSMPVTQSQIAATGGTPPRPELECHRTQIRQTPPPRSWTTPLNPNTSAVELFFRPTYSLQSSGGSIRMEIQKLALVSITWRAKTPPYQNVIRSTSSKATLSLRRFVNPGRPG